MSKAPLFFLIGFCILLTGCKKSDAPEGNQQKTENSQTSGLKSPIQHLDQLLSFGPRPPQSAALQNCRQYIARELSQHGWIVVNQEATLPTPRGPVKFGNLIARYSINPANDVIDQSFMTKPIPGVLCAHLDSKDIPDMSFLGADDAASACALIVYLGQKLAKEAPKLASQLELVFFDGEEAFGKNITNQDGLYGSKMYARSWQARPQKPRFGILLDMIGHKNLAIAYPSDSPPQLEKVLLQAADTTGHRNRFKKNPTPIIDDHLPLNMVGIPAIDIIGDFGRFNWWHQEGDKRELISEESLKITEDVVHEMLKLLLK